MIFNLLHEVPITFCTIVYTHIPLRETVVCGRNGFSTTHSEHDSMRFANDYAISQSIKLQVFKKCDQKLAEMLVLSTARTGLKE